MVPLPLFLPGVNMPTTTKPNEERKVIGYTLEPIYETPRGYVVTQAFILCTSCGSAISSNGGPKYNSVCLKCIEQLDLINRLKQ
jgi:hypothetical protein